jgi:hypothetical protein
MIKFHSSLIILTSLFFGACGSDHDGHGHSPDSGTHVHSALNGGMLVEVGEHGAGYNLELCLHEEGFLQIYVLDAHAEGFVRIAQPTIEVIIPDANGTQKTLVCDAMADPVTGETVGDSALFTSIKRIGDQLPLKGMIPSIQILSQSYENISFEFNGNSAAPEDDH